MRTLRLDRIDVKILEIVQGNGRISKKALASEVGLSLTACFGRLQRLEKSGFIQDYRATVNAQRLGSFIWVYTEVTLSRHRATDFSLFENAVKQIPEIFECDAVGGGFDYLFKSIARDVNHYQSIIEDLLNRSVGIDTYFTYIVTKSIKRGVAVPVARLLEPHLEAPDEAARAKGRA
jgi:Lrp/AsnC family transcriptional regulator of ectoine degradation